ncbi:MAG: PaaI family thioesterase [Deltaproteobacteria bacterium]|nr:PaaI family thioesterase [Deltaproteobacteria bacterium]MBW2418356.1 PaaI family thioesterase [Deltaproteobacteria bacterium]
MASFKPNYSDTTKTTEVAKWNERRRLAAAIRRVTECLVPRELPEEVLRRLADDFERTADEIVSHPRLRYAKGDAESTKAGNVAAYFDQSPFIGLSNPVAPPISIRQSGEKTAVAEVEFGDAYEGTPKTVHGGFVAATFDELLGYVQSLSGHLGVTARFEMKCLKPTPTNTPLLFEAECLKKDGRKIFTRGQARAGDVITAEAEALFIAIDIDRR